MASLSSMLLRGLGQGASKHSLRAASTPLLSSSAARRSPSLLQTRGIYADATGKTYERQGLVMYVHSAIGGSVVLERVMGVGLRFNDDRTSRSAGLPAVSRDAYCVCQDNETTIQVQNYTQNSMALPVR
jgi:hypothetical protein